MSDKSSIPIIRALTIKDLQSIAEIDTKVLGLKRLGYWEMKLALVEKRSSMSSLVAEWDGKVIGFIIGDAGGWEYGVPDTVGWIDTIGVHPDFDAVRAFLGCGIGRIQLQHIPARLGESSRSDGRRIVGNTNRGAGR